MAAPRRGRRPPRAGVMWLGLFAIALSYVGALVAVRALDPGEACSCGGAANATGDVLLVGDSISAGYYPALRTFLEPTGACDGGDFADISRRGTLARVVYARFGTQADVCGTSFGVAPCVERFVAGARGAFRVIHWNWGLHDVAPTIYTRVTLDEYAANLARIHAALASALAPNGTIVFATTTPVPPDYDKRTNADVVALNDVARRLFESGGAYPEVQINDLYGRIVDFCNSDGVAGCYPRTCGCPRAQDDGIHFSPAGYRFMAISVAAAVAPALAGPYDAGTRAPEVEESRDGPSWDHWKIALAVQLAVLGAVGVLYAAYAACASQAAPHAARREVASPRLLDAHGDAAAPFADSPSRGASPGAPAPKRFNGAPLSIEAHAAHV